MNILSDITGNINPTRNFNLLYIILDSVFVCIFLALLVYKKRYITAIFSLLGGVIYFIVDFGYFYLLSSSRVVMVSGVVQSDGITAAVLLWMSLSYGITNFAFIWLCLKKDKYLKEWLVLIIGWWLVAPSISGLGGDAIIQTYRTTTNYHAAMAIILVVGYLILIGYNFMKKGKRVNILWVLLIGVSVQFCWEAALLINGIRPGNAQALSTLIVNSLIETNLGLPYIYFIFLFVSKRYDDDLRKVGNLL